ncbi:unnamed protein product [Meganyctiphanes norvegica]|uniref:PDZ domain-containing protein n=1 Tax=Meganyctiphanes norvegica TaxID=48144 RepID=A0AAV2QNQ9_MEGNR
MGKTPEQQMLYIPPPTPSQDSSHTSITNFSVVLLKRQEQLGIHVIQSTDDMTGQDRGLLIEEIEPDGRIAKDQRIHLHDIIVNVNNQSLIGISFERAKEIFSNAMQESELHLQIVRNKNFAPAESSSEGNEYTKFGKAPSTPQKVSSFNRKSNIQQGNTRKIGTRITVSLTKGQYGFGFSITTRDNHLGGEVLVYIKSILPKGSAIEDGNLRVGDRLLKINGIEVTGLNQADIVTMLRNIPQEGQAVLTLSRQGAGYENTDQNEHPLNLPKKGNTSNSDLLEGMPSEKSPEDNLTFPWKPRKILSFRIPVHSSEKDGIGIKVKGKAVSKYDGYKDLGIFVKSIIEGGAAAEDGQLQLNDQLININGMSLLEKSNNDAMKIIYTAMNQNVEHEIFLTIARRFDGCDKSSSNISGISSDIEIDSSPRLTSTPNQNIKKENSQNLSQKMLSLNNFVDSEISNVSCDSTIIYDEQNYSDFNEYEVNECPGTSFRSVSDNTVISEDSNLSQVSIEKSELGFSRDELWRQSMSEKRPATLDGKNTDTLQRNKKAREERERQRLLLMQENVLNDENEIQHLSPKRSLSVNEDLTRLCFNSTNEHNKPFFLNSTEEYEAKSNKKSVMFNSLSSIFKFNKSNHRQIEKEEYVSGSHQKTCSADLYLNGEEETGVLY